MTSKSLGTILSTIVGNLDPPQEPARGPGTFVAVLPEGRHFSRCPAAAAFDARLTDGEVRCLAAVGAFTDRDALFRSSQKNLAKRMKVPRQSVNRWFTALVAKGYLRLVRRGKRADGSTAANLYKVIYPPVAAIEATAAAEPSP